MTLATLGRLFVLGLSMLLAADGLASVSAGVFAWPRIGLAALGGFLAVTAAGASHRRRIIGGTFGLGAIGGFARAGYRVVQSNEPWTNAIGTQLVTLLVCGIYFAAFLHLTEADKD